MNYFMQSICLSLLLVGCSQPFEGMDSYLFGKMGKTLFSKPKIVRIKDIHLETGNLLGKQVMLQAEVIEVSKKLTYAIVKDAKARLLVKLVEYPEIKSGELKVGETYSFWGSVHRDQKAFPVLYLKEYYSSGT